MTPFNQTSIFKLYSRKIPQRFISRFSNDGIPLLIGSIVVGLMSVLFEQLFSFSESVISKIYIFDRRLFFVLSPLLFVLSYFFVVKNAKFASGSGIPQMLASIELSDTPRQKSIQYLLSLKIIVIKILSSILLLLGGGSIGREGPTLQISGSIFYLIHKIFPSLKKIDLKTLLITGGASGLSAAFNTPLGGIVYVVEELTKSHINKLKTPVFAAVIIAGFTTQFFTGSYLFLGFPKTEPLIFKWIILGVILSALGGIFGSLFTNAIQSLADLRKSFKSGYMFALLMGLLFATLLYFTNQNTMGTGKHLINEILFDHRKTTDWFTFIGRFFGSLLSFSSGGAGGIFSTSLASGASLASFFLSFFDIPFGQYNILILMTMIAFLTGVTRTPFTSAVLVLEMTDRHSAIFFFLMAALISQYVSEHIQRKSFYEFRKDQILEDLKS